MKNFLISLLVVLAVLYFWGELSQSWYLLHLTDVEIENPLVTLLVLCALAGGLILLGVLLTVSLLGALFLGFGAAVLAVLFVGIHLFWPLLFIALILYLVFGGKKQPA